MANLFQSDIVPLKIDWNSFIQHRTDFKGQWERERERATTKLANLIWFDSLASFIRSFSNWLFYYINHIEIINFLTKSYNFNFECIHLVPTICFQIVFYFSLFWRRILVQICPRSCFIAGILFFLRRLARKISNWHPLNFLVCLPL